MNDLYIDEYKNDNYLFRCGIDSCRGTVIDFTNPVYDVLWVDIHRVPNDYELVGTLTNPFQLLSDAVTTAISLNITHINVFQKDGDRILSELPDGIDRINYIRR